MYRLVPSQEAPSLQDSPPPTSPRGVLAGFALVIVLSLLGFGAVALIGYYLPQTAAKSYWFVSRSSGVIAYVLVTIGVLWGLIQSGSLFRARVAPLLALGMHSFLNWLGLGLAAFLLLWLGGGEEPQALPQTFSGLNDVGNRPAHCGVPAARVGGLSHDSDNCYFATQGRMT